MSDFKWDDGMSVGVEAIDNDHKNLLALVNKINNAINNGGTDVIIGEIFQKLEDYAKQHFSREEALLEQCHYDDLENHKKQHQTFIDKIPALKDKLLNTDSIGVAQEVSLFLTNWLMNHIVVDDMSYAQSVYDRGLANVSKSDDSRFERVLNWIGLKVILDKRIFFSTLAPVSGLLLLSLSIFLFNFQQYNSVQNLLGLTDSIRNINSLGHSLQTERGFTTGYISSNYQIFSSELKSYRNMTNEAIIAYQKTLDELSSELISNEMRSHFEKSEIFLAGLEAQRNKVDEQRSLTSDMQAFYTDFISNLVSVYDAITRLKVDADLVHNIAVLSAITHLKEAAARERAFGAQVLGSGELINAKNHKFSQLVGEQIGLLKVFEYAATKEQKNKWNKMAASDIFTSVTELETAMLDMETNGKLSDIDRKRWFTVMTAKINQLHLLTEELVADVEIAANKKSKSLQRALLTVTGILAFVVIITMMVSWLLNQSILYPFRQLTDAMTRLSDGHRDVRFTDHFAEDEIGKMVDAYERSRRTLLQADISSAIRFKRQSLTLKKKEREKARYQKLASVDALTGAVNRRRFSELADLEMMRAKRYKRGLSVMMLDIDYFKEINDTYGHVNGDSVLKAFYQTCFDNVRNTDIVARIGGEEFVVLMPETNLSQAGELAERVREAISKLAVTVDSGLIRLTVSIGVAIWDDKLKTIDAFVEKADDALYEAKRSGRNRVVTTESEALVD